MCYPKPGPRCSKHARETLSRLVKQKNALVTPIAVTREQLDTAVREKQEKKTVEQLTQKLNSLVEEREKLVTEDIVKAQRVYDSTPAGLRALREEMAKFTARMDAEQDKSSWMRMQTKKDVMNRRLAKAVEFRERQIMLMKLAQENSLLRNGYRLSPNMDPKLFREAITDVGEKNVYVGKTTTLEETPENMLQQKLLQSRVDKLFSYFESR